MYFETPAVTRLKADLRARNTGIKFGTYNRRPISGKTTWSQHSWPNAVDIYFTSPAGDTSAAHQQMLDRVAKYIRDAILTGTADYDVRYLLWRTTHHYDHIHVDFWPKGYATPSTTRGGSDNLYMRRDGTIITQAQLVQEGEDMGFDYTPPADLTQEGKPFFEAWEWAENLGIANQFTKPLDIVEKQEFFVFLKRYHDAVTRVVPEPFNPEDYEVVIKRKEV